jgi:LPS export ABC transporter protein LptC
LRAGRKEISPQKQSGGKNGSFSAVSLFALIVLLSAGCSFDYGDSQAGEEETPDIIMNDVEYVRVRDGSPQVRFQAELAERYEESRIMELKNFSFEQFDRNGEEINATGKAGTAHVELDSGDIRLDGGVTMAVESEDIVIETVRLDWKDEQRDLSGDSSDDVKINRANGTSFSGRGFSANARSRVWGFSGGISGTYIHDDDEEEESGGEGEPGEAGPADGDVSGMDTPNGAALDGAAPDEAALDAGAFEAPDAAPDAAPNAAPGTGNFNVGAGEK